MRTVGAPRWLGLLIDSYGRLSLNDCYKEPWVAFLVWNQIGASNISRLLRNWTN